MWLTTTKTCAVTDLGLTIISMESLNETFKKYVFGNILSREKYWVVIG